MRLRLTRLADADVGGILQQTLIAFGENQFHAYTALIERALQRIAQDPDRASARRRDDIRSNVRSYHLALAASRQSAASHLIYFMKIGTPQSDEEVVVLRVLHERMEPRRRVLDGLRAADERLGPG